MGSHPSIQLPQGSSSKQPGVEELAPESVEQKGSPPYVKETLTDMALDSAYSTLIVKGILLREKLVQMESNREQKITAEAQEAYKEMCVVLKTVLSSYGKSSNLSPFENFLSTLSHDFYVGKSKKEWFYCGICPFQADSSSEWEEHLATPRHTACLRPNIDMKICDTCCLLTVGSPEFLAKSANSIHHLIFDEIYKNVKKASPGKNSAAPTPQATPCSLSKAPEGQQTFDVYFLDKSDPSTIKRVIPPADIEFYDWISTDFLDSKKVPIIFCNICSTAGMTSNTIRSHMVGKTHLSKTINQVVVLLSCTLCPALIFSDVSGVFSHLELSHGGCRKCMDTNQTLSSSHDSLNNLEEQKKPEAHTLNVHKITQPVLFEISSGLKKVLSSCKSATYWNRKIVSQDDISHIIKEAGFAISSPTFLCIACEAKIPSIMSMFQHIVGKKHLEKVEAGKDSFLLCPFCEQVMIFKSNKDIKAHVLTNLHKKKIMPLVEPSLSLKVYFFNESCIKNGQINDKDMRSIKLENFDRMNPIRFAKILGEMYALDTSKHGCILYICDACFVRVEEPRSFMSHLASTSHCNSARGNNLVGIACRSCRTFTLTSAENSFEAHFSGMEHLRRKISPSPSPGPQEKIKISPSPSPGPQEKRKISPSPSSGPQEKPPEMTEELSEKYKDLWKNFGVHHIVDEVIDVHQPVKYTKTNLDNESILSFIRQQTRSQHEFGYSCTPCRKEFLFNPEKLVAHMKTDQHLRVNAGFGVCCHICGTFIVADSQDALSSHVKSLCHIKYVTERKREETPKEPMNEEPRQLVFSYVVYLTADGTEELETPQPTRVNNDADYINSMFTWVQQHFQVKLKKLFCCQCIVAAPDIKVFLAHRETQYHLHKEKSALSHLSLCIPCGELHFFPNSTDFSYHIATTTHQLKGPNEAPPLVSKMKSLQKVADSFSSSLMPSKPMTLKPVPVTERSSLSTETITNRSSSSTYGGDYRKVTSRPESTIGSSSSSLVMGSLNTSMSDLSLDSVIKDAKDAFKMTKSAKRVIRAELQVLISGDFPLVQIHFFGSREVGLGKKESALDILIDPGTPDKMFPQKLMKLLQSSESLFKVKSSEGGKIRANCITIDFPCCFHLADPSIVETSTIIKILKDLDDRVLYALLSIRLWAEENRLTNEIPAYCFDWLVIFYFMQPTMRLLPPVQVLLSLIKDGSDDSDKTNGKTLKTGLQLEKVCPKSSTEIMDGFYEYYSVVSFKNIVLSPLTGKVYPKSVFEDSMSVPEAYPRDFNFSSVISDPVVILDPLTKMRNLFAVVSKAGIDAFQAACRDLLEDSD